MWRAEPPIDEREEKTKERYTCERVYCKVLVVVLEQGESLSSCGLRSTVSSVLHACFQRHLLQNTSTEVVSKAIV